MLRPVIRRLSERPAVKEPASPHPLTYSPSLLPFLPSSLAPSLPPSPHKRPKPQDHWGYCNCQYAAAYNCSSNSLLSFTAP